MSLDKKKRKAPDFSEAFGLHRTNPDFLLVPKTGLCSCLGNVMK